MSNIINRKPKVFISYQSAQKGYAVGLNEILRDLAEVYFDPDKVEYRGSFDDYMRLIKFQDVVVLFVSTEYLQSLNCMYEVSRLMDVDGWSRKTHIFVCDGDRTFKMSIADIEQYWENELTKEETKYISHTLTAPAQRRIDKFYRARRRSGEFLEYVQDIKGCELNVFHHKVISEVAKIQKEFNELIKQSFEESEDSKSPSLHAYNSKSDNKVYLVDKGIDYLSDDEVKKIGQVSLSMIDMPICVIYTGGSAGEVRDIEGNEASGYRQATLPELIAKLPNLNSCGRNIHFFRLRKPINSANILSKHWLLIADTINKMYIYYRGFVIIHGSHTIAYTASALSFMFENLTKPIILTGSELPLDADNSDAINNIQSGLSIVDRHPNINEVCICYNNVLLRGNRTTKKMAIDKSDGFHSPNYMPIGKIQGKELSFMKGYEHYKSNRDFSFNPTLSDKVKILEIEINPQLNIAQFSDICKQISWDAIIIRTYGLGEIPQEDISLSNVLKEYISNNGIVISIPKSQIGANCAEITSVANYATLLDIGVTIGGDMVSEATYCKLIYLFQKYEGRISEIRDRMTINLCGEMSASIYWAKVGAQSVYQSPMVSEIKKFAYSVEFDDMMSSVINKATIRIVEFKVKDNFANPNLIFSIYSDTEHTKHIVKYDAVHKDLSQAFSLNIEVPNLAASNLLKKGEFSLYLSTNHSFEFKSLSIIAFVDV